MVVEILLRHSRFPALRAGNAKSHDDSMNRR
jgi:hypothetical protein